MSTTHPAATEFTDEEICRQAQGNAVATGLALFVYARDHGATAEDAARWLGAVFAPGWAEIRGQGARQAARAAALNLVSLGANLQELAGDEQRATVTVREWPGAEARTYFGISQADADATFTVFATIAEAIDLRYYWQREGDAVTMTFEQLAT